MEASRAAEELAAERAIAETRRLLIQLADAWGHYQDDPSAGNKMRVQGIVGALPGNCAKEIGYAVDVPRDHWAPGQWPLEGLVENPDDRELVRQNAPMIELIWNLWQVGLRGLVDADLSQPPRYWHRVEDAVYGYIDLVRRRETGDRELVFGPRDRKHREAALKMLEQVGPPGTLNPPTAGASGQGE
ncbi:hypothetical protein NJB1907f44_48910 [Mycobacterium marinum]|uniref:hypothetical protein n=1 Tax=Mycobacterium marinum TaxID=1781 RepID=UPI000E3EC955|nr:hypothetical protein [Mycobacterium marinum]RFZ30710.1 hypothetical protein KST_05026 [Mycobacterium marinum]GJN99104.1 hypothetical protein NJB1907E8_50260 [Mycobacterium marinum]GJO06021.1 hypothetical protein NJB1907E90_16700 [Mycobacterium marinum]GJO10664.1 hypothetical protein NJB1808e29_46660 [Mycobacterium marinum]GJO14472.1 hypothetical protein NJB1907f34b_50920 [Mycobacterium marinum]